MVPPACRVLVFLVLSCSLAVSQPYPKKQYTDLERQATRVFNLAKRNPLALYGFLLRMPKGADLHVHLSGGIYAETFLTEAKDDNLCINVSSLSLVKNVGMTQHLPQRPLCEKGAVPAGVAFQDQKLYDSMLDSLSMRGFVPSNGLAAHDQFFATFDRFNELEANHQGEWLDELANRAAAQNEQYLEIMQTPSFSKAAEIGTRLGWPGGVSSSRSSEESIVGSSKGELDRLRDQLFAHGLRDEVATDRKELNEALEVRNRIEHCGQKDAHQSCAVKIRYLYQILRNNTPQQVFAQTLLGFEVASVEPNVVGINFVQPEDAYFSMSEYKRQMRMLDYLHSIYPKVHISLHAGELAPGLVRPEGLRFHIHDAVDVGHAERIGHGVDIMYEDEPKALLKELAARHVLVEVNLTSNEVILGVAGRSHPLPLYMAANVPIALSTDDEGVSRTNLTNEYKRAVIEFNLTYPQLKEIVRASMEHSFAAGQSLWAVPDRHFRVVNACAKQPLGVGTPSKECATFLNRNEKAADEWELERRFHLFETKLP
ncbi:adenosine deaminase family protein [Granulicella arctica]|uniref:adenosine deaminase n=1 Tax=Granulicella arctica TaxID=940613 RepID=A0A7Y9PJF5_9BACT|nr:adenosine deaminase [Granulicella arctica]NYF80864.1 adenosine deaminase [Granulicella arctica]